MPIQPRPEIERVPAVPHGGFHSSRPADLMDFSSNVNPFGPSPLIWDALRAVPIDRHPDPRAEPLRRVLAEIEGVNERELIVGNGSVDLIYHLSVAYLRPGDRVLIVGPTFGEYAAAVQVMGAEIARFDAQAVEDFRVDMRALLHLAREAEPRLMFLCNPNNPTGAFLEWDEIEKLLHVCPNTLLVLDEAFIRFAVQPWSSRELPRFDNLLILRSLTKDYALTGLRVGYAMAHASIIGALEKVQPPWSVNALAQAASVAALQDEDHLRRSLAALKNAKDDLVAELVRLQMSPVPSSVHFFLLPVRSAAQTAQQLQERNILVRDCASFGLPTFIRIATRKPEDNARLVVALQALRQAR